MTTVDLATRLTDREERLLATITVLGWRTQRVKQRIADVGELLDRVLAATPDQVLVDVLRDIRDVLLFDRGETRTGIDPRRETPDSTSPGSITPVRTSVFPGCGCPVGVAAGAALPTMEEGRIVSRPGSSGAGDRQEITSETSCDGAVTECRQASRPEDLPHDGHPTA